jgi:hypothetical protein
MKEKKHKIELRGFDGEAKFGVVALTLVFAAITIVLLCVGYVPISEEPNTIKTISPDIPIIGCPITLYVYLMIITIWQIPLSELKKGILWKNMPYIIWLSLSITIYTFPIYTIGWTTIRLLKTIIIMIKSKDGIAEEKIKEIWEMY